MNRIQRLRETSAGHFWLCLCEPVEHKLPQLSAPCCLFWALVSETSSPHCSDSAHSWSVCAACLPIPFSLSTNPDASDPRLDPLGCHIMPFESPCFAGHFKCVSLHSAATLPAAYNAFLRGAVTHNTHSHYATCSICSHSPLIWRPCVGFGSVHTSYKALPRFQDFQKSLQEY